MNPPTLILHAMRLPVPNRTILGALAALTMFGALSAFLSSFLAVAFNGAGVPLEHPVQSPFSSYFVPGLILGVVIGGTQLNAALTLLWKRRTALLLSVVAGFGMLIWVFVELAVIRQYSWLQDHARRAGIEPCSRVDGNRADGFSSAALAGWQQSYHFIFQSRRWAHI